VFFKTAFLAAETFSKKVMGKKCTFELIAWEHQSLLHPIQQ